MRVNHGKMPPNGPHYPVAPGVTLRAHTFDLLYPLITEWRQRQGIPPGDPVLDVNAYVCARWPSACLPEAADGPRQQDLARSMTQRVATWSALAGRAMPQGGYDLVGDNIAKARANICLICPYNKPWKTNCANCNRTSDAILATVRRLRSANASGGLFGCEIDGSDNATAVFLDDSDVDKLCGNRERVWIGCWKRKTTK